MKLTARGIGKSLLIVLGVLFAVALLYIGILIHPSPLFRYEARYGDWRVWSDAPIPDDMEGVVDDAVRRVGAMEHEPAVPGHRVYLCNSPKLYKFFAVLTRMGSESLAIGLSAANGTFVRMGRVREFADRNQGMFRHTRFEGNLAEVIAHEIAHFNSIRALGLRTHASQPVWKSEGWAEYQANIAAIRADPSYDLRRRIGMLIDDRHWNGRGGARDQWEWQLLVEFLGEVEGYRLADLAEDDVTRGSVRERMMDWYRRALPPG